jgi:hypothetical protein
VLRDEGVAISTAIAGALETARRAGSRPLPKKPSIRLNFRWKQMVKKAGIIGFSSAFPI